MNFSFNQKFGYTFIGMVEQFHHMALFMDETNKLNSNEFIFLISNLDGVIYDISASFLKLVRMSIDDWEDYEELRGKKV